MFRCSYIISRCFLPLVLSIMIIRVMYKARTCRVLAMIYSGMDFYAKLRGRSLWNRSAENIEILAGRTGCIYANYADSLSVFLTISLTINADNFNYRYNVVVKL